MARGRRSERRADRGDDREPVVGGPVPGERQVAPRHVEVEPGGELEQGADRQLGHDLELVGAAEAVRPWSALSPGAAVASGAQVAGGHAWAGSPRQSAGASGKMARQRELHAEAGVGHHAPLVADGAEEHAGGQLGRVPAAGPDHAGGHPQAAPEADQVPRVDLHAGLEGRGVTRVGVGDADAEAGPHQADRPSRSDGAGAATADRAGGGLRGSPGLHRDGRGVGRGAAARRRPAARRPGRDVGGIGGEQQGQGGGRRGRS